MKDASITTIYDMENGGASLVCHQVDARDFLKHPRWSATPPAEIMPAVEIQGDSGEVMKLKELSFKTLQAMAAKAGLAARTIRKMNKAALVDALK
jgi:hypothetical protein